MIPANPRIASPYPARDRRPPSIDAIFTQLRDAVPGASLRPGADDGTWRWRPHRRTVRLRHAPAPHGVAEAVGPTPPDGSFLDATVPIAEEIPVEHYLAALALFAQGQDTLGTLRHDDDRRLSLDARFWLPADAEHDPARLAAVANGLLVLAWSAESLLHQIASGPLTERPDMITARNAPVPNDLLAALRDLGSRGQRAVADVALRGTSKLGPWFVGTEQDDMLTAHVADGWRRRPDAAHHAVRLDAPPDAHGPIERIEIRWAHQGPATGPALHLAVVTRLEVGDDPAATLRRLADAVACSDGRRDRLGTWLPERWLDGEGLREVARRVERGGLGAVRPPAEDERAAWVVTLPTADARAGSLARVWRAAEAEVVAMSAKHARSVN